MALNRYEVIFIAHSDLSKDEVDKLIDRYKEIVSNFKGMVVKVEKWGMRKLAYRIEKQAKGFYALMDYVGNAAVVNEVERNFKFDDKILRFQTIKKADSVDMKAIEKEISGEKEEAAGEAKPEAASGEAKTEVASTPVEAQDAVAAEASPSDVGEKEQAGGNE